MVLYRTETQFQANQTQQVNIQINTKLNKIYIYFLLIICLFFKSEALLELESNSSLNRALLSVLKNSFFEKKPLNWKPVKYELVVNTKLTEEFQRKFTFSNFR